MVLMMHRKLMITVILVLMNVPVGAFDRVVQPRIDAGIMDYRLEVDPVTQLDAIPNLDISLVDNPVLSDLGAQGAANLNTTRSQDGFRVADNLTFVNTGVTLFVDRWYTDFSYLRAFDGRSRRNWRESSNWDVLSQGATVLDEVEFDRFTSSRRVDFAVVDKFDRDEVNFTIGYAVTEYFSVFGGYRYSSIRLNSRQRGSISGHDTLTAGNVVLADVSFSALHSNLFKADFRQHGPFIGTAYAVPVNGQFLRGALNFNAAIAYQDARLKASISDLDFSEVSLVDNLSGQALPRTGDFLVIPELGTFSGDAVGISLGVVWRGLTAVEGLSYGVGVNAYNYQFTSDSPREFVGNISERVIRYQLGVAYQF